ncbi:MAG: di-trans,poly-cis-decaprenylcistransferase [Symploca sp. SIO2E6]|nr:di-trans,poly-cis-decaprenylcistransferase [Symploca sp. SIO2E6]
MYSKTSSMPPRHIAIIPDGNRRWARNRGLPVEEGHKKGFIEVAPLLFEAIWNQGIEEGTLWMFSTENWQRSEQEVKNLMEIFGAFIEKLISPALEIGVRLRHLGRKDRIPIVLRSLIEEAEHRTRGKERHLFNLALDYGGKDEIVRAVRQLVGDSVKPEEIDENRLAQYLRNSESSGDDPDLIVRTSGEYRLSGFMPLRSGYSELYFTDTLFPDMNGAAIERAIEWFQNRDRRFGK